MAFGLTFTPLTRSQLVRVIRDAPIRAGTGAAIVCTANLDHIVTMRNNDDLRAAYRDAWCVTADGMPVFAYARLKGEAVPARVTGSDLVGDLVLGLQPRHSRCFFVASCEATGEGIRTMMVERGFAPAAIAFVVPPFGFENDRALSETLAERIREHRATHVFFGVGAPKSEVWTHTWRARLGDCYVLNAGAGLDYVCGVKRRAPRAVQKAGLEWAWRFAAEPRRLFRRYFINSWGFLTAIVSDLAVGGA